MKTVITSTGNNLESTFDLRFGRAGWFCVYNTDDNTSEFIENPNKEAGGGAGSKSVEMIAELGVKQVISGDFGPKAKPLLEKLKIQMIILEDKNLSVLDIISKIHHRKHVHASI